MTKWKIHYFTRKNLSRHMALLSLENFVFPPGCLCYPLYTTLTKVFLRGCSIFYVFVWLNLKKKHHQHVVSDISTKISIFQSHSFKTLSAKVFLMLSQDFNVVISSRNQQKGFYKFLVRKYMQTRSRLGLPTSASVICVTNKLESSWQTII